MIDIKDRVPNKPNRILITPEGGATPFYATWTRADEPFESGTPINKALFDSIVEDRPALKSLNPHTQVFQGNIVNAGAGWNTVSTRTLFGNFGIPIECEFTPSITLQLSGGYTGLVAVNNVTKISFQYQVIVPDLVTGKYISSGSTWTAVQQTLQNGFKTTAEAVSIYYQIILDESEAILWA